MVGTRYAVGTSTRECGKVYSECQTQHWPKSSAGLDKTRQSTAHCRGKPNTIRSRLNKLVP
ncbi:LOW QUALITY PROTEIN: hypothetical protein TorRG33x02_181270 [Trema orientale]|uniref:Uncharacterized protein n=1 Tax=Trema orientale TaxID=63057 RepID=A0A2P5EKI8_TREOI|nr:LOW QUALITY PROTEIN: hypothetical protein TorRG33x02_181270 [Trema orientale]